jgi:uncharacterized protein YkwD
MYREKPSSPVMPVSAIPVSAIPVMAITRLEFPSLRPPRLAALLLLLLAACSGEGDALKAAESALRRGDLEGAASELGELEGKRAVALRERIAETEARREEGIVAIAAIVARAPAEDRRSIVAELRRLPGRESDPELRRESNAALSYIEDLYASGGGSGGAGRTPARWFRDDSLPPAPLLPEEPAPGGGSGERALAEGLLGGWDERGDEREDEPAISEILERDPPREELAVAPASEPPVPDPVADSETLFSVEARARERLRAGDLPAAREAWFEAARRCEFETGRGEYLAMACDIEDRLRLRDELIEAFAAAPEAFGALGALEAPGELGFEGVVKEGVQRGGELIPWRELPLETWIEAGRVTDLSARAELGLVWERLLRRDQRRSWARLSRLLREGRVEEADVFGIVARYRQEGIPRDGYAFVAGEWIAAEEAVAIERGDEVTRLVKAFSRAEGERRDELFWELYEKGFETELRAALQVSWDELAERFDRDPIGKRLRHLAERREELDRRREAALELIFDEEEYFYPYNPPECPPDKARLYAAVQRRVDELVGAVREVWGEGTPIPLRGEIREIVEEAGWLVEHEDRIEKASILPDSWPYWALCLDLDLEEIDLASFAWDEREAKSLAYSRAVRAYNVVLWTDEERIENGALARTTEQKQVRVTNDYRLMFGREALVWNTRIQAAANDHSEYMSNTGDFGHFEPEPDRKGPRERMARRGYDRGTGENCHAGGGDPMGAHVGWIHSSGHHRNLLATGHRGMASGLVGRYWTQDFGKDESFQAELPGWPD